VKRKVKFFPVVFCLKENKAIALGLQPLKYRVRNNQLKIKEKVEQVHWQPHNSIMLAGYEIDFTKCQEADKVFCPKCGGAVDFRVFPSSTIPKLTDVDLEDYQHNPPPQLPVP